MSHQTGNLKRSRTVSSPSNPPTSQSSRSSSPSLRRDPLNLGTLNENISRFNHDVRKGVNNYDAIEGRVLADQSQDEIIVNLISFSVDHGPFTAAKLAAVIYRKGMTPFIAGLIKTGKYADMLDIVANLLEDKQLAEKVNKWLVDDDDGPGSIIIDELDTSPWETAFESVYIPEKM